MKCVTSACNTSTIGGSVTVLGRAQNVLVDAQQVLTDLAAPTLGEYGLIAVFGRNSVVSSCCLQWP